MGGEVPVEHLAGAAAQPRRLPATRRPARAGVEQVEVDMEALQVPHVAGIGDLRGLDHASAAAASGLGAVRRSLVSVELEQAQAEVLGHRDHVLERRVDEHPAQLGLSPQRGADALGFGVGAAARAALEEDHPERPSAELSGELGIGEARDAADLDVRAPVVHTPNRSGVRGASAQPPGVLALGTELGLLASVTRTVFCA